MALAYLAEVEGTAPPGHVEFVADLGSNGYYEYRVGSLAGNDSNGLGPWGEDALAEVAYRSGVQARPGGVRNPLSGAFVLRAPARLFAERGAVIQLASFRDAQRNGPAYSLPLRVARPVAGGPEPGYPDIADPFSLPATARAGAVHRGAVAMSTPFQPARTVAFGFEESVLSHPMVLDELMAALRSAAPALLAALPGLLGAGGTAPGGGAPDLRALVGLLETLGRLAGSGSSAPVAAAPVVPPPAMPAPSQPQSLWVRLARREGLDRPLRSASLALATSVPRYSQAMDGGLISGPLLAALLGPLLQTAPQLLQVLTDKPLQFLGTLLQSQIQGKLQQQQAQQAFVADLLAEANRSALLRELLGNLPPAAAAAPPSTATALGWAAPPSRPPAPLASSRMALSFVAGTSWRTGDKSRWVYDPSHGIVFTLDLIDRQAQPDLPPLPRAILEISLIDLETQRELLSRSLRLTDLRPGVPLRAELPPESLRDLPRQRDLQVVAVLRWPVPGGSRGVRADHPIYLAERSFLKSVDSGGEAGRPLSDPQRYRAFWNKIFEGGVTDGRAVRWELDLTCRYYIRVALDSSANGRIESRLALEPQTEGERTRRIHGRLKSGLELSLGELNKLLPLLGGQPELSASDLAALAGSELRPRLDLQGTARVQASGKRDQRAVVWVYPTMSLDRVTLCDLAETDRDGLVTRVTERTLRFPFPRSLHLVTLKSD